LASSERFKASIASMDFDLSKLRELRPKPFPGKSEVGGILPHGLIPREIAKVFPDSAEPSIKGNDLPDSTAYSSSNRYALKGKGDPPPLAGWQ